MKFEKRVRELNLRAKIMRLSAPRRYHPKAGWIYQDRSMIRRGGELLNPVVVCGAGHIQGRWA